MTARTSHMETKDSDQQIRTDGSGEFGLSEDAALNGPDNGGRRADEDKDAGQSLSGLLDQVESLATDQSHVSIGNVLDSLGRKSFAPALLVPGLIMLAPGPADIPVVPVILGAFVIIVAAQIVLRREHLWVPGWLERQRVKSSRIETAVGWLRRPAGWLDRIAQRRMVFLVHHAGATIMALTSIAVAATTPILEFIPFSANLAGAAITAFGVAMLAQDGLIAGIAIAVSLGTFGLVGYHLIAG